MLGWCGYSLQNYHMFDIRYNVMDPKKSLLLQVMEGSHTIWQDAAAIGGITSCLSYLGQEVDVANFSVRTQGMFFKHDQVYYQGLPSRFSRLI